MLQSRNESPACTLACSGERMMVGKFNRKPQTDVARSRRADVKHAAGRKNYHCLKRTARMVFEVGMQGYGREWKRCEEVGECSCARITAVLTYVTGAGSTAVVGGAVKCANSMRCAAG